MKGGEIVKHLFASASFLILTSACTPSSTPVAPSNLTAPTATVAITNVTASVEPAATTGFVYHVAMNVAETGGKSTAAFATFNFLFPDGRASVATVTATTLAAGAAEDTGNIDVADTTGTAAEPSLTVALNFADANGRVATTSSAAVKVTVLTPQ